MLGSEAWEVGDLSDVIPILSANTIPKARTGTHVVPGSKGYQSADLFRVYANCERLHHPPTRAVPGGNKVYRQLTYLRIAGPFLEFLVVFFAFLPWVFFILLQSSSILFTMFQYTAI